VLVVVVVVVVQLGSEVEAAAVPRFSHDDDAIRGGSGGPGTGVAGGVGVGVAGLRTGDGDASGCGVDDLV